MIPFVKCHACGNDFLIVDEAHSNGDHAAIARWRRSASIEATRARRPDLDPSAQTLRTPPDRRTAP